MCGCKGKKNNGVARVFSRNANIQEPTQQLQYNGIGNGLLFVGQSTKAQYQVSTDDIVDVYESDINAFLKYVQKGKKIFTKIDNLVDYGLDTGNEKDITVITVLAGDLVIEETPNEEMLQDIANNNQFLEITNDEPFNSDINEKDTEEITEIIIEEVEEEKPIKKAKKTKAVE